MSAMNPSQADELDFDCQTLVNAGAALQQIGLRGHMDESDLVQILTWAPVLADRLAERKAGGSRFQLRELAKARAIPAAAVSRNL